MFKFTDVTASHVYHEWKMDRGCS